MVFYESQYLSIPCFIHFPVGVCCDHFEGESHAKIDGTEALRLNLNDE
jgi:hypothetical protein